MQKLVKGDVKKKRKRPKESEEDLGGLKKGSTTKEEEEECVHVSSIADIALMYIQRGRRRGHKS